MNCPKCQNQISQMTLVSSVTQKNLRCPHCEVELRMDERDKKRIAKKFASDINYLYLLGSTIVFLENKFGKESILLAIIPFIFIIILFFVIWPAYSKDARFVLVTEFKKKIELTDAELKYIKRKKIVFSIVLLLNLVITILILLGINIEELRSILKYFLFFI